MKVLTGESEVQWLLLVLETKAGKKWGCHSMREPHPLSFICHQNMSNNVFYAFQISRKTFPFVCCTLSVSQGFFPFFSERAFVVFPWPLETALLNTAGVKALMCFHCVSLSFFVVFHLKN